MSVCQKPFLFGLERQEIAAAISEYGDVPTYRKEQLYKWMYARGILNPLHYSDIPKPFREWLNQKFEWNIIELSLKKQSTISGVNKYLYRLHDQRMIEGVWIPEKNRSTLCVSSQVGCALGCKFCATGTMGLHRNLLAGEILSQAWYVRCIDQLIVTHIVFMGMGEPLHNYRETSKCVRILNDPTGFAIGRKHITVSTAGWVPKIYQMIEDRLPCRLAISMGSPKEDVRAELMPVTKRFSLKELMLAAKEWTVAFDDYVTIEYTLIEGVNDSLQDVQMLVSLLKGVPSKVNVLTYNPISNSKFQKTSLERTENFIKELEKKFSGPVTRRLSRGDEINAACGQLVVQQFTPTGTKISYEHLQSIQYFD
ncbi:MAG: 23S rRNA (adenine(2503)-C(2))-methyltransferase RlmN [bacterium]|nr:23S rRNA (adenine(2503)-C(2))-methyltransferase RlmN [bacterium]